MIKGFKSLQKWLVGQRIVDIDYSEENEVLALTLADDTVLLVSTQLLSKGVKNAKS